MARWASDRQQYEDAFRSISRNSQKNMPYIQDTKQATKWKGFGVTKI